MQLQIDQLTMAEKLRIMEELWDDLRTRADGVPVPNGTRIYWKSVNGSLKLVKRSLPIGRPPKSVSPNKRREDQDS